MRNCGNVLYQPGSTRGDFGTLVITAANPCIIPFYFEMPVEDYDGDDKYYAKILPTDKVVFVFKSDQRLIDYVLRKEYTNIGDNVVFLTLSPADMRKLYGNKEYVLGVTWYTQDNKIKKVLIPKLTVRVEGVVQDV